MKAKYLLGYAIVVLMALVGCSDELDNIKQPIQEGDVIQFSASADNVGSRTSYGDLTNGEYPVYWENNDEVVVYCPQAKSDDGSPQEVTYTVSVDDSNNSTEYGLTGTNAMKWGSENEHHFYTFYPADNFTNCTVAGLVTANLPQQQEVTLVATETENGTIYTMAESDHSHMQNALMAGHLEVLRSTSDGTVVLPFTPITTAVDIEVTAPAVNGSVSPLYVKSVTIANQTTVATDNRTPLSGTFTYDVVNKKQKSVTEASYFVNVVFSSPVVLTNNSNTKIKFTAFLLPGAPTNLRIILNCHEGDANGNISGATTTKVVNANGIVQQKKNKVIMGNIPTPIEFSYETWMASLHDDTYVSQISLPGTHDAGAYPSASGLDNALAQTQFVDIITQLNAGIRVLDFRPKYVNGTFNIAHGYVTYEDRTFDYVFEQAVTWLAEHPTEFIMVQLKNEFGSDSDSQIGWQTNMRNKLLSISEHYRIDTFDPEMTLKDARGKILFLSRDFYVGTDGDTSDHNHASWVGGKFNFGVDNNNFTGGFLGIGKSFDNYWSTNVFTNGNSNSLGAILFISDHYKGAWLGSGTGIVNPDEGDKQQCISETIKAAYTDKSNKTWYLNFLNVSGTDRTSSKYNDYAATLISGLSATTYQRVGIIMLDWACPFKESGSVTLMGDNGTSSVSTVKNSYKGYEVTKAVIDNNFKGGGPAKAQ